MTTEASARDNSQWCFAWFASTPTAVSADRGALLKNARWNPGDIITISFLDGDPLLRRRVKEAAQLWTESGLANLILDFREDIDTMIRISFRYKGSWSVIGTTCQHISEINQATMNFGWITSRSSDEEVRSVVLHEFGHGLGLIHEHQSPGTIIHWNKEAVIKDLSGSPYSWSISMIERNIFEPFAMSETNYTAIDARSIMMYPIPTSWTTDGFSAVRNKSLSEVDRAFINQQYP